MIVSMKVCTRFIVYSVHAFLNKVFGLPKGPWGDHRDILFIYFFEWDGSNGIFPCFLAFSSAGE